MEVACLFREDWCGCERESFVEYLEVCVCQNVCAERVKNGVVLVVSLLLGGFHSVCVFFVLLALLVGCGWCGSVGLVVL